MLQVESALRLRRLWIAILAFGSAALPGLAGPFEFNTIVRLGAAGSGPAGWEVGVGDNTGAPLQSGSLPTYWSSGQSRAFQLIYDRPSNTLQTRIYSNTGSSFAFMNYTPAGGPSLINSIWTLPARSFFATALSGANVSTTITISNLALSAVSGALNILTPIQQTTMQASSGPSQPTQTVTQSQDIVFRGDSTGSWRLFGFLTMNFSGLAGSPNPDLLQFGLSALNDVPEPSTLAMLGLGLGVMAGAAQWLRRR